MIYNVAPSQGRELKPQFQNLVFMTLMVAPSQGRELKLINQRKQQIKDESLLHRGVN